MTAPLAFSAPFAATVAAENAAAGATICSAAAVHAPAMTGAVLNAMGAIGVPYVGGYAPAQASNLACTTMVGTVHMAIGTTTTMSQAGYLAADAATSV